MRAKALWSTSSWVFMNLGQIVYFLKGIEMTEAHEKSPAKAPFKMDDKKSDKKAGQQSSGGGSNKRNQLLAPWQECGSQLGEVQESACQFKKGRSWQQQTQTQEQGEDNWKNNAKSDATEFKKEHTVLVQKSAAKAVKKELNRISEKHTTSHDNNADLMAIQEHNCTNMDDAELKKIV